MHGDGEVVREVRREEKLGLALREGRLAGNRAQLDDVQLGRNASVGLRRLLRESHQLRLLRVPGDVVRGERGGVRLERLRALLRRGVQLHVALDERRARGVAGRDAHEREPRAREISSGGFRARARATRRPPRAVRRRARARA